MAYFTLVFHDGETRQKKVLHIDDVDSLKVDRPQVEAVERLPHRGTYLGQYGEGIVTITWEIFFGHEDRMVDNVPISGNEQFIQFRQDIWERWSTLKSSPSRTIKENTKLEYHAWDREEHFWCTLNPFEESMDQDNPNHFEGTVVFRCYEPISGDKITVSRPVTEAVAAKAKNDLSAYMEKIATFNRAMRSIPGDLRDQIYENVIKPTKQITKALDDFVKGVTEIVLYPVSLIKTTSDLIATVVDRMGDTLTWPLAQVANILRNTRRSLHRLMKAPGAFKQSLRDAYEDLKAAAYEIESDLDTDKDKARKRSGSNADRLAGVRNLPLLASGARKATAIDGDTIQGVALRELGDASRYREIALLNDLDSSADLAAGQTLLIPVDPGQETGTSAPLSNANISAEERFYGRDFLVVQNKSGLLQVAKAGNYDTATVAGIDNCKNALLARITVEQGTLHENALYGFASPIGDPQTVNDKKIYQNMVERTALQDPRFSKATADVSITGNAYAIDMTVTLAGATGQTASQDITRGL